MWIKLLGAVLVTAACSGIGAGAAWRLRERIRLLETLKRMTAHLRGEILYANAPLPQAMLRTAGRERGEAAKLFQMAGEGLEENPGEAFACLWEKTVKTWLDGVPFGTAEEELLLRMGRNLSYRDREMQERAFALCLEELEQQIGRLRREEPEKCRLFGGLGVLSGLFISVMLL